jgi:LysM repeat protein
VGALKGGEEISGANYADTEVAKPVPVIDQVRSNYRSVAVGAVLITLAIALVGGFAGSWFQSRMVRRGPEVWSVRTSGSQIAIARLDESNPSTVTLSLEQPAKTTGEQKFSSFTDVKQYLEMISRPSTASNQPSQQNQAAPTTAVGQSVPATENKSAALVVEYRAKPGDSLMKLAWRHQVSPEKLKELNPNIVSWRSIKIGQKIALPSPTPANQPASPQGELVGSANSGTNTTEITVGPGDSVMKIARCHNVSQKEIRKLNPNIVSWPLIQIGQRISLPSRGPTPANSPATSQVQQTSASPATTEVQQPSASPAASPVQPPASPNVVAGTKQVRGGRGESLNALAQRYSTTPRRLKLLNPRIRNWPSIQPGQKVVVPVGS